MNKNDKRKPLKILKLDALLRRLPKSHPKLPYIETELGKSLAGWRGEQALDYYLSFLPEKSYSIVKSIRLKDDKDRFFQIDRILISQKFLIIIEIKNMAGTLYFNNEPQQLVQIFNNEEKAYSCPVIQVERQKSQLETFLKKHRVTEIPIIPLVVISHTNTVIKIAQSFKKSKQIVIHGSALPTKVKSIEEHLKQEYTTQKEVKKVERLLLKYHEELNPDYLTIFEIPQSNLLTGVACPSCQTLPMYRKRGSWYCPTCQHSSKDAHIAALQDYSLLIDPTINNQKLRNFLHLPSESTARKILSKLKLTQLNKNRGRIYVLDKECLFKN